MYEPWLILGLGNPGEQYAHNRHNVGFMVADVLAERIGERFRSHKARAAIASGRLVDRPVVIAKPRSYMNLSGGPAAALRDFYKVATDHVVAIHDEMDIPYGALRLKLGGGTGGHNGIRSMTTALGGAEFYRVRIGVGRPPGRMDPAMYVLRDFAPGERKELGVVLERAADAVEAIIRDGLPAAQNIFHTG